MVPAIITISDALERHCEPPGQSSNALISAACLYFEWAGPALLRNCENSVIGAGELLSRARENSPVGRWRFWKERLTVMTANPELDKETRDLAQSAADCMSETESVVI